ncbi:FAD-dependent oxidoreductase [Ramlibacter sp.]|uniref:FAD-dependent oxidoreductase n=1 Tax=Ramlibacter sp. TaxID=1917967 RepID=UPI002C4AE1C1|nr:FAD-dependent oxidoreductase [Ramlibacter sp.]HWI82989.1 FAD-dependent oxidoreductase [Ramlibacter sp.]
MVVTSAKTAPCQEACPAGVDVPRYLRHVRDGRFGDALAVVRERIPFPLVCGHACFHPCEAKCGRAQFEGPVAIRMLKRVAAQQGAASYVAPRPAPATGRRAAVIGAGPCGLTAAYELVLQGHEVTVFEALDRPGGMLRFGIPAFRLPDAAIDSDIAVIAAAGVRIRTGSRVPAAEALLAQGFDAVLIASGAWQPWRLAIPGEDLPHVLDGLSFLRRVNAGTPPALGGRVVVIGGGNTAVDAARVSRRLGAEVVQVYRRGRAEMPAAPEEVAAALEEGVRFEYLLAPLRIDAAGVTCIRMALGEADAGGRPRPVPVPCTERAIAASTVIVATGQEVRLPSASVAQAQRRTAAVDPATLATSVAGIFAGGDAVLGPASIIEAIAQGRQAAGAIDRFLGGSGDLPRRGGEAPAPAACDAAPRGTARHAWPTIALPQRLGGFAVVEQAYDTDSAMREASRCLSCDQRAFAVAVDPVLCKDCGYCREVCAPGVFTRSEQFNASGYQPALAARPERCIGCLNCLSVCPDFAIAITDRREGGAAGA